MPKQSEGQLRRIDRCRNSSGNGEESAKLYSSSLRVAVNLPDSRVSPLFFSQGASRLSIRDPGEESE